MFKIVDIWSMISQEKLKTYYFNKLGDAFWIFGYNSAQFGQNLSRAKLKIFPSILEVSGWCHGHYKVHSFVQNCWYMINDISKKTQNLLFQQIGGCFLNLWLLLCTIWAKFIEGKIENFPINLRSVWLMPRTLQSTKILFKILVLWSRISHERLKTSYFNK